VRPFEWRMPTAEYAWPDSGFGRGAQLLRRRGPEAGSGPVQVTNRYGTVHTEQSADDVTIDNQFGNVFARSDRGALSIANRYGDVNAWVDDADLAALSIMSRLGRVNVSLGEQVPFRIDAVAERGRIVSGLPFEVRDAGNIQQVSAEQGTADRRSTSAASGATSTSMGR